ncbi:hypothetical protein F5I97DRAFT_1565279 [Phlebopus sp. FC_14]|nr:hypothetical protein F5I97DRAFT_1565279 [Phlebopus sp. FC_14]
MLSEIQTESLQDLLTAVRSHASPPGDTRIPSLDDYLSRHTAGPSLLNSGDVIEIQGPPASGKTHLLYHFVLNCIMPSGGWNHSDFSPDVAGRCKSAIIYDMDLSFDIRRLHRLLLMRIARLLPLSHESERAEYAEQSLRRLHIFRPTALLQLATSIKHLGQYHASNMPNDEIGLLAVDSMSTFYWSERFSAEQLGNIAPHKARNRTETAFIPPIYHVLTAIQSVRNSHGPLVIITNWGLNPVSQDHTAPNSAPLYKQHLRPFPVLTSVTHLGAKGAKDTDQLLLACPFPLALHITLSSPSTAPFPSNAPPSDALRREAQHRKVNERGEVTGLVRCPGSWEIGRFTFNITNQDIV